MLLTPPHFSPTQDFLLKSKWHTSAHHHQAVHGTATLVVELRWAVNSLGRAVDDFCQRLSHRFLMDRPGSTVLADYFRILPLPISR
ncbi:Hypothetical protein, putative [Bodo saltans]|uniref:Uncharacterized protein n=1 Tax=Bodo saltans TaxID=75058 RepID=A0A0S4J644_BODSA|nr:Hypothetical protein, putative [Bodo saltans]|eukprot:CUG84366.1 Hypothetical protein, putative [Bodo saltans]